ncbi:response regulator [Pseudomonas sp. PDM14]|uniref:response regulator n=1 Tax=Pseudomonas sp. PDM14 TaxID=2769288 RepID=UPI001780CD78|nr:response regulator [Pseudomonas sp. PDM14]MBD9484235.1 response regulator [Pseudomonas sp. PDM14]
MSSAVSVDEKSFRRILTRNVALPIGTGVLGAGLFVSLIAYLLYVLSWVEHTDAVINQANEGFRLSIEQQSGLRGYLIAGEEHYLAPYQDARSRLGPQMQGLRDLVRDNAPQLEKLRRIESLQAQWAESAAELIEMRRSGQDITTRVRESGGRVMESIREQFNSFIATEQQLRHDRNDKAGSTAIITIALYLLFNFSFSGLLAFVGRRELLGLSTFYGRMLEQQQAHNEQLKQQAWLREGQSQLAERIVGQPNMVAIGRTALAFIGHYLDMVVGAFYVRQDDGSLQRVADYGFSPEQQAQPQSFKDGVGLVGQVAVERRVRVLEGLTTNYLQVNSGLGHDDPLAVILAPLENEGVVNGVIELGFLRPVSEQEQTLLRAIGSNLGTALEVARYRQRLHEVLSETQQLNEELQVQQEELKSANEELEHQAQMIRESQASLEVQQAELEQTNEQLSNQTRFLTHQRDELDQRNHALAEARGELETRAVELQRASRYKSEFLANMSHELRTPLNSSLILSRLLADNRKGNLDEQQTKYAELIYSSGKDLLNLINDILDLSKVEAGRLELRPEETSLQRLTENLENLFRPQAVERQLDFAVSIAAGTPAQFVSDSQRVEQIIKNLLSNAFKFTRAGKVGLQVSAAEDGIAFAVSDTGIGISEEQQGIIFEAFRQADGSTNRLFGGTGLGLSISRNLAQVLGGHISVNSTPGQGSVFTLWLPLDYPQHIDAIDEALAGGHELFVAPPPQPAAVPENVPRLPPSFADDREREAAGRCVLVVEDEAKFAQILYDLARELNYRCLVAHSSTEALSLLREHRIDAILLDMRLPDEPGLSLLQRLKEEPSTRHIPVHVISTDDRTELALHLGAIGYAQKPATRESLVEVFSRLEAKLTQKVKRVLVVEGDAQQRDSISQLVDDEDIEVTGVSHGEQALELLRQTSFDCMITDLKLPDMHGNELLTRMAGERIDGYPPVIVYVSRPLTRGEEEDLRKHSRSIIIKGARSPERLLDEVTLFLHKVEAPHASDAQRQLSARNRDKVFENRQVLVVDDDMRNVYALISALDEKGVKVVSASNGQEALDKLEKNPGIDLVLMDVMMPVMDGFEAMRRIRQNPRWGKLPIIAVTAKAMKDDQEQCLSAGASDYLAKPLDLERLFSLIRVWLPRQELF